jgi:hypothetical protein
MLVFTKATKLYLKHTFSFYGETETTKQKHFWIDIHHIPPIYKRNLGSNTYLHIANTHGLLS